MTTHAHHLDDVYDLVAVLPGRDEAAQDQDLEVLEHVRVLAVHDFHELRRQLKWRTLESQILGRDRENEPKVNMYDVPRTV